MKKSRLNIERCSTIPNFGTKGALCFQLFYYNDYNLGGVKITDSIVNKTKSLKFF